MADHPLPSQAYAALIATGAIEPDEAQRHALGRMDALCQLLAAYEAQSTRLFSRLRRKLSASGGEPPIVTVRGVGYRMGQGQ